MALSYETSIFSEAIRSAVLEVAAMPNDAAWKAILHALSREGVSRPFLGTARKQAWTLRRHINAE
jgi:hypothetical protein